MLGCLAAAPVQVQLTRPQFQGADPLKPCCNWALAVAPAATENPGRPLSRSPVSSTQLETSSSMNCGRSPGRARLGQTATSARQPRHSQVSDRVIRDFAGPDPAVPAVFDSVDFPPAPLCDRPSRVIEVRQRPRKVTSTAQTGPNCDDIESTSLFRRPLSDPRRTTARLGVRASGQAAPPVAPGRDALRLSLSLSHHIAIAVPSRDTTQVAPPGARGQHGEFPGRRLEALC